jgi:hypothetical protein
MAHVDFETFAFVWRTSRGTIWRSSLGFLVEATDMKMRRVLAMAAGASALLSADAFMTAPAGAGLRPTLRAAARPVSSLGDA